MFDSRLIHFKIHRSNIMRIEVDNATLATQVKEIMMQTTSATRGSMVVCLTTYQKVLCSIHVGFFSRVQDMCCD